MTNLTLLSISLAATVSTSHLRSKTPSYCWSNKGGRCVVLQEAPSNSCFRTETLCASARGKLSEIACSNGKTFSCHHGQEGCFDNSPRFCNEVETAEEVPRGAHRKIKCSNGHAASCYHGTEGCFDFSHVFCKHVLGVAQPTLRCWSNKGGRCVVLQEAPSDSCFRTETLCASARGKLSEIACSNGKTFSCHHGEEGCFDNSPRFCGTVPAISAD